MNDRFLRTSLPDPLFSANIYCDGFLDEVLRGAVAPFWKELRRREPKGPGYLWVVRYGRRGEHLKVRLHGPEEWAGFRALLVESVTICFAALGAPQEKGRRSERMDIPPMDEEDAEEGLYPDRTLLWTRYRRSHVSLPAGPYLRDDHFLSLFTPCLGVACERTLAAFRPLADGKAPTSLRRTTLLQGLISGLGTLGWPASECCAYLAYHRDWLIRFSLCRNGAHPEQGREILARFEEQAVRMGAALERLRSLTRAEWEKDQQPHASEDPWHDRLAHLAAYLSPLAADPERNIDPYTSNPVFAPLFKVFHGFANTLGLNAMEEGYTHHLLLQAATMEAA
ncbi:MAG TPA: lantibiotic dehydratase C-terminal domain-containing protein [Thermoanaerobaculia bacterium]